MRLNERRLEVLSRDKLISRLVKAGELEVSGASPEEIASYFDTEKFRFHGPAV
jgi:hypothetical protein